MDRLTDSNLGNEFRCGTYWKKAEASSNELQDNIDGIHKIMNRRVKEKEKGLG